MQPGRVVYGGCAGFPVHSRAMSLLELSALQVGRGTRTLTHPLSLSLKAGDGCHLTGPNGIGKTTLLETAAGLRPPWTGEVRRHARAHWLGHRNALAGNLTPEQNLDAWAGLQADVRRSPLDALAAMGVPAPRRRLCRQLSAGQRRRAALARLLIAPRPLWILDEPLDGLDRDGLTLLAGLIETHRAGGGALLITSHQPLPAGMRAISEQLLRPAGAPA